MSALQGYVKATRRRKQLIASFVEQFNLKLEKTRVFCFQFHIAKLNLERCSIQSVYYTDYEQGALQRSN